MASLRFTVASGQGPVSLIRKRETVAKDYLIPKALESLPSLLLET